MGNGSADFANYIRHLTLTNFLCYFTSLSNHENPFRLLLQVLYNNNETQEQNQIKNIKSSLYSLKYPLNSNQGCREFAGPISASKRPGHIMYRRNSGGPLATCVGFDRRWNRTRSPAQDSPLKPDASATRPSHRSRTKVFFMTLYIL